MKVICIDAFKYDYLKSAPYLSSLTKGFQHGSLETPLGFFSAMETFFKGKSETLAMFYHTQNSSLKWTKYLRFLGRPLIDILINLQRLIKNQRQFILTHHVPLNKLHYFDTSIKKLLHKSTNIEYKHILELDKISHKYGTKSLHTKKCIKKIDKVLEKEDFDLVLSDHGMMDIKETIKVPETEVCFIDATMARYWYKKPKLDLKKGEIIKADQKFGETIFLANPGILIIPNYWQGNKPVKAMHGYDPKHPDMKGFYILKREGKRKDLRMIDLHNLLKNENLINPAKL